MTPSSVPAETIICQNLAGDSDADRQLRVTLLRLYHACSNTEASVEAIGYQLSDFLRDPEPTYTGRLLHGAVLGLIGKLDILGLELRKSERTLLPLTKERWSRLAAVEASLGIEERQAIEAE